MKKILFFESQNHHVLVLWPWMRSVTFPRLYSLIYKMKLNSNTYTIGLLWEPEWNNIGGTGTTPDPEQAPDSSNWKHYFTSVLYLSLSMSCPTRRHFLEYLRDQWFPQKLQGVTPGLQIWKAISSVLPTEKDNVDFYKTGLLGLFC